MKPYRYPDIPSLVTPNVLDTLTPGDWLAQFKFNGFRTLYEWDGELLALWSRHKRWLTEPTWAFRQEIVARLRDLPPCIIDGEWMGRRAGQPERAWFFDMLAVDGEWIGNLPASDRFTQLQLALGDAAELVVPWFQKVGRGLVQISGYRAFYEHSKAWEDRGCEGVVLKKADGRFFGRVDACYPNPGWLKVKFLGGEDGKLRLD